MQPRTRIVETDPHGLHAAAFYERHQRLYVAPEIVRAILELAEGWSEDSRAATAAFEEQRQRWERHGGYLGPISLDEVSGWFAAGSFFLAEVAAPNSEIGDPFVAVAQKLFWTPTTEWVVPLLVGPNDVASDRARYEAILGAGPRRCAASDFLGVLPEWAGHGLAGAASYAGILELIRRNRSRPADAQLRYLVGHVFSVQGLDVLGGRDGATVERTIRLADFGQPEIVNERSIRTNTMSRRTPTHFIGKRTPAGGVPVVMDGARYALRAQWNVAFQAIQTSAEAAGPASGGNRS